MRIAGDVFGAGWVEFCSRLIRDAGYSYRSLSDLQ